MRSWSHVRGRMCTVYARAGASDQALAARREGLVQLLDCPVTPCVAMATTRLPKPPGPGPDLGPFPLLLTGCSASCD